MTNGLLRVGELPKVARGAGRKPGKWKGHEQFAKELRTLAEREKEPERRWAVVAEGLSSAKSQSIAAAIKKGEAIGFEHAPEGRYEASTRRSEQPRSKKNVNNSKTLFDVWARYCPSK